MSNIYYKVTATNRQGYVSSVSFQKAANEASAIQTAKAYHGAAVDKGCKWDAEKVFSGQ